MTADFCGFSQGVQARYWAITSSKPQSPSFTFIFPSPMKQYIIYVGERATLNKLRNKKVKAIPVTGREGP
jgi:hypothetical protein